MIQHQQRNASVKILIKYLNLCNEKITYNVSSENLLHSNGRSAYARHTFFFTNRKSIYKAGRY